MIARSMIAGAALMALATGCCPRPTIPAAVGLPSDVKSVARLTEAQYTDTQGNTLTLTFDATETKTVKAVASDGRGGKIDVVSLPLSDMSMCVPAAKTGEKRCQPLAAMTDGALVKFGTKTCICYIFYGYAYCIGDTCH